MVSIGMYMQNFRQIHWRVIELQVNTAHGARRTQSDSISPLEHSSKGLKTILNKSPIWLKVKVAPLDRHIAIIPTIMLWICYERFNYIENIHYLTHTA